MSGYFRFETLGMAGWYTRRHLSKAQLKECLRSASGTFRYSEDTPPGSWVTEFPEGPYLESK